MEIPMELKEKLLEALIEDLNAVPEAGKIPGLMKGGDGDEEDKLDGGADEDSEKPEGGSIEVMKVSKLGDKGSPDDDPSISMDDDDEDPTDVKERFKKLMG